MSATAAATAYAVDRNAKLNEPLAASSAGSAASDALDSSEDGVTSPCGNGEERETLAEYADEEEGFFNFLSWNRTSMRALRDVEDEILSHMRTPYRRHFVPVGKLDGKTDCKLWTVSLNETSSATPLVMVHGFASGTALWCLNLDDLAQDRPVHAVDVLGFGRSSRPSFGKDGDAVEAQFIASIENFRQEMGFEKMILLGHSFGGYLVSLYTMAHPDRVAKLVLADPWGYPAKTEADDERLRNLPFGRRMLVNFVVCVNPLPLSGMRCLGRMGPSVVSKVRGDIIARYSHFLKTDRPLVRDYIYHCNAQEPAGERAFKQLDSGLGWARNPLLPRMEKSLPADKKVTFIFGRQSWISSNPGDLLARARPDTIDHNVIEGNHHVYACFPDLFNVKVREACEGF